MSLQHAESDNAPARTEGQQEAEPRIHLINVIGEETEMEVTIEQLCNMYPKPLIFDAIESLIRDGTVCLVAKSYSWGTEFWLKKSGKAMRLQLHR
jgi:hypothetical protein